MPTCSQVYQNKSCTVPSMVKIHNPKCQPNFSIVSFWRLEPDHNMQQIYGALHLKLARSVRINWKNAHLQQPYRHHSHSKFYQISKRSPPKVLLAKHFSC